MKQRKRSDILPFLATFLAIVGGAHFYMIQRLAMAPAWPAPLTRTAIAAMSLLGALLVALPMLGRSVRISRLRPAAWLGYVWMGMSFYLLVGLWSSDLLLWAGGWGGTDVLQMRALWVVGLATLLCTLGAWAALGTPNVRRLEIACHGWPSSLDGYRIVQLSDIHIGPLLQRSFATRIVERTNSLAPDLIAITGDIVDGSVGQLAPEVAPFRDLSARDGVFVATGNHDHYAGADAWTAHFESLGLRVLYNAHTVIGTANRTFVVAGVSDRSASREGDDVAKALEGAPPGPKLLLAHHPQTFAKARHFDVSLQLSGHTHGGQLWPFTYLVNLQTRWIAGVYRLGDATLYVSRGTGFWGPPMRVLAPAEITEITLRAPTA